jgi:hypothetical protein
MLLLLLQNTIESIGCVQRVHFDLRASFWGYDKVLPL